MLSANELQKLKKEAKECYPKTEEILKYFTNVIEKNRIRLGASVADFSEILGLSGKYQYVQMFQAVKRGIGVYNPFALVQFCLLFGYDFQPNDKKAINTQTDRACQEMASLLAALPKSTLLNVASTITSDQEIPPQLRKDYARTLSKFINVIYPKSEDFDNTLNYRKLILAPDNEAKTSKRDADKSDTDQSEEE